MNRQAGKDTDIEMPVLLWFLEIEIGPYPEVSWPPFHTDLQEILVLAVDPQPSFASIYVQ